jgi:hypothetical protein
MSATPRTSDAVPPTKHRRNTPPMVLLAFQSDSPKMQEKRDSLTTIFGAAVRLGIVIKSTGGRPKLVQLLFRTGYQ